MRTGRLCNETRTMTLIRREEKMLMLCKTSNLLHVIAFIGRSSKAAKMVQNFNNMGTKELHQAQSGANGPNLKARKTRMGGKHLVLSTTITVFALDATLRPELEKHVSEH
ncbi:hypothetical protein ATANTOWER_025129 [Ataeniobius toweri]|uniref:Uncharacterized protein n=1 Tax=Ataeniobius toweri TaxID=208326 RepID=A0ABU7AKI6_9TELE|nr:hypothetical protein [Ataeniobius toweri]